MLPNQLCHCTHQHQCLCFQLGFSLTRRFVCLCVCADQSLVQVAVHNTQQVIMGLSVTCYLWWAFPINIYNAVNQPHTEHCDSNHPSFLISPSRSILISISSVGGATQSAELVLVLKDEYRKREGRRRAKRSWHQVKPELKCFPLKNQSEKKLMSCF